MNFVRTIAAVGGYTMISRATGFLRDMLIASIGGAGPTADAFFVAFQIPNFFRRLTGEGALTVAFVPMFAEMIESRNNYLAITFAGQVQSILLLFLLILLALAEFATPNLIMLFAPGFIGDDNRCSIAIELTKIIFPYLVLISLVALWGGMLNSIGKFSAMAAAPILLNLIMIASLLITPGILETPSHALAWSVTVAGIVQAFFLAVACHQEGILPPLVFPHLTPEVKRLLVLISPAALGAGVIQLNAFIGIWLASLLPTGSISYIYYADRIIQLPLGVVGVAIGTAILPMLARQIRAKEAETALLTQHKAMEIGLFLTVPIAILFYLLADPLIALLFQRGAFSVIDSEKTASILATYAAGLPAFVLIKILQPGFFARQDTSTPVKIAIVIVIVNVFCSIMFLPIFDQISIAVASVISSWLNAVMLATLLYRRRHIMIDKRLFIMTLKIFLSATAMASGVSFLMNKINHWLIGDKFEQAIAVLCLSVCGTVLYIIACLMMKIIYLRNYAIVWRNYR
ncbi:integral membrane protein MviN [Candidatus Endolissoclinum faulkneri L2]|uniref:Probable lipid II flippase MurJ n=1 Tax=Candidatus Endolissoclinum faulkneri L2 TaxID=1193729 RepID=K7Z2N2_9PROT|nr:murein biosynthesis integral membrane protein MurJ [Candidatus Endolissoclinum faulkneri]AFX98233.1 integral membrane protein MviN [Candidatus Endolissoclinum faulkneri L2]